MNDIGEFLKDFAIGYAVGYAATTIVEENQKREAERQGVQTFDDQTEEEMYELGKALEKINNGQ